MILVTGASGLLGANLVLEASRQGHPVTALYHRHRVRFPGAKSLAGDLTRREATVDLLRAVQPDWVIHAAALTDVDWCEDHPDDARRLNAEASGHLAEAARSVGAGMLLVSTDAVFDGRRGGYSEDDEPSPVNVYGETKWQAEKAVRRAHEDALIIRTNIFGWNATAKRNLAEWVLERLETGREVPGFRDVTFTPILVNDLSGILLDMMDRRLHGLYHVAGSEALTKYEFARRIAQTFGHDPGRVNETTLADSAFRAPRPKDTSLATTRVSHALGRAMPDVEAGIRRFRAYRDDGSLKDLRACSEG